MVQQFLNGVKVLELPGLAPVPFCGMILADFGAEVTLVINKSNTSTQLAVQSNFGQRMARRKRRIQLNFKAKEDREELGRMCAGTDVLLDPYRPGTLESMGLDPSELRKENPGLVVARITGYGQTGPMALSAGHDINYVATSGLLPTVFGNGRSGPPWPPANLLADFAAGGLLAAFGVVAALFRRTRNGGQGCVLDCAMSEGLAYLGSFAFLSNDETCLWQSEHALFSGKCPIYRTYETSDGKWMAVGALEAKFQQRLFKVLGLDGQQGDDDPDQSTRQMERIFKTKTRQEWTRIFREWDACVSPVLDIDEVGVFDQHEARKAFARMEAEDGGCWWMPREVPRPIADGTNPLMRDHDARSKL